MDKKIILEQFAMAYKAERYPPLSGKIIGLFMLTNKKYLSFQEIQDELEISKGALSKNLKLLIEINRIEFIQDENNSRKRLFCLDIKGAKKNIYSITENFQYQNDLVKQTKEHRKGGDEEVTEFLNDSIAFSEKVIEQLKILTPKYFK